MGVLVNAGPRTKTNQVVPSLMHIATKILHDTASPAIIIFAAYINCLSAFHSRTDQVIGNIKNSLERQILSLSLNWFAVLETKYHDSSAVWYSLSSFF